MNKSPLSTIIIGSMFLLTACGSTSDPEEDKKAAEIYGVPLESYVQNRENIKAAISACQSEIIDDNVGMGFKMGNGANYINVKLGDGIIHVDADNVVAPQLSENTIKYSCDYDLNSKKAAAKLSDG